jgi:F-type H+-transporting ATPase subunit a
VQIPKQFRILAPLSLLLGWGSSASAAGGGAPIISYYAIILSSFGVTDPHAVEELKPVLGSVLTLILTLVVGLLYRKAVTSAGDDPAPVGRVSLRGVVEMVLEFIHDIGVSVIGERAKPFLPALFGVFVFIFLSNLTGLVPGFTPATESINTNLVLGLFIFLVFNVAGIKEHGLIGYLKTYAGPILLMAPIIFFIEAVGMLARPLSLALRLYGNIFGDHLVLAVFTDLTKLILPSFLLFFGLLVACLQSFVFTLLSSIYISMAISHDH